MNVRVIQADQLLRVVRTKLAAVSVEMTKFAGEYSASQGKTVTCVPGCANCCYQKILVTAADGMAIYAHLRQAGRWTAEMIAKLVAADEVMTDRDHYTHFVKKTPCTFLDETKPGWGECSIYAVRPISCVATFSNGGDASECAVPGEPREKGQFQVAIHGVQALEDFLYLMMTVEDLVESGREPMLMTLPGAVLWAASVAEHGPPPDVRRLPLRQGGADEFDAVATHRREVDR